MCGRFACYSCAPDLRTKLVKSNVKITEKWQDEEKFYPSYNLAPRRWVPVLRMNDQDEVIIQTMRWGFIPFWAKQTPDVQPINARDETLTTDKSMFDSAKQKKRCIVVADGFYEWKKLSGGKKVPYYTKRKDGKLMLFAGLYDVFNDQENALYTCTIITTASSSFFSFLHDRMPVILENGSQSIQTWLDRSHTWNDKLVEILKPYKGDLLCYQVTDRVGPTKNNSPDFIVPVDQLKGSITSFFKKKSFDTTSKRPVEEQEEIHDPANKKAKLGE